MFKRIILLSLSSTLVLSCKVGPDYKKPETQLPKSWISSKKQIAGKNQINNWWKIFDDPILESLIAEASEQNLNLKIAKSKIEESRAARSYAKGDLFPEVNASATASRNKQFFSPLGTSFQYSRFGAGLDATWELDLFGSKRRVLEAANADLEAIASDHDALQLTLSAEVARNYIELRSFQNQLQIANKNLAMQLKIIELTEKQLEVGKISQIELMSARTQLEMDQANALFLEGAVKAAEYNIEALLGKKPGFYQQILSEVKPVPVSDKEVILKTPTEVIAARPDIRAAERRLASSTATQGIARSYQYPKVSISALIGFESDNPHDLIHSPGHSWGIAGNITAPLFQFGKIQSSIKIADKQQEQALLQYQQIILESLRDVETNLVAYTKKEERRSSFNKAAVSSKKIMELTEKRYEAGHDSLIDLMNAKKNYYIYQTKLINSEALTSSQLVTLYKSVGGFEQETR